jgi:hypothetical protein
MNFFSKKELKSEIEGMSNYVKIYKNGPALYRINVHNSENWKDECKNVKELLYNILNKEKNKDIEGYFTKKFAFGEEFGCTVEMNYKKN